MLLLLQSFVALSIIDCQHLEEKVSSSLTLDDCVPPSLSNGDVYGEGDDSSWTGEFKCKPGFALVGSSRLKCRNGQWSGSIPACAGSTKVRMTSSNINNL